MKKKSNLFINAVFAAAFILPVVLTAWQFSVLVKLRQEAVIKKKNAEELRSAKLNYENLEKNKAKIDRLLEELSRQVPLSREKPLSLVKSLINIGSGQFGFKDITVAIKESLMQGDDAMMQGMSSAAGGRISDKSEMPEQPSLLNSIVSERPLAKPKPTYIEMEFRCSYSQLIGFLQRIWGMERLMSLESITVKRDENMLPDQKVGLMMAVYAFDE